MNAPVACTSCVDAAAKKGDERKVCCRVLKDDRERARSPACARCSRLKKACSFNVVKKKMAKKKA
jgi:hypothetical protein